MFPNNYTFNPGVVLDPVTMAPMISNGGSITVNPIGVPTRPQQKIWQKMFIRDIPQECPNDALLRLLNQFGNVKNFKRMNNPKGGLVTYCYFELETGEQILRIQRLFKNIRILDKTLQLKISLQTQNFLKEWLTMQKDQWRKKLNAPGMNQAKEFETIEHYNQRDDKKYLRKIDDVLRTINSEVKKIAIEKMRDEERRQHPRQKQRQKRKKQFQDDMRRKFIQKEDYWLKRERQKEREYRKEKDKERERERAKYKRMDREMDLDPEEEEHRLSKFRSEERRKALEREEQEDLDRILEENPPQPEDLEPVNKVKVTVIEEKVGVAKQGEVMMEIPENQEQDQKLVAEKKNQIFENWQMNEENLEEKPKVELNLPELPEQNKELQEAKKKQLMEIAKKVPQNKMDLWQYPIDWDALSKSVIFEKKIRPWLEKRSLDYMGGVEEKFIALVLKKLLSRSHPDKIIKILKNLLDQDAQEFVIKLWKTLIFQLLKLKQGIM